MELQPDEFSQMEYTCINRTRTLPWAMEIVNSSEQMGVRAAGESTRDYRIE